MYCTYISAALPANKDVYTSTLLILYLLPLLFSVYMSEDHIDVTLTVSSKSLINDY